METTLIHMSTDDDGSLPNEEMIRGWMLKHYPATKIEVLPGKGSQVLVDYLNAGPQNTMVVMGAYGRSGLSRLMHRSLADDVIEKTRASVFIVHE